MSTETQPNAANEIGTRILFWIFAVSMIPLATFFPNVFWAIMWLLAAALIVWGLCTVPYRRFSPQMVWLILWVGIVAWGLN
jgi:hypothetical protein